MTRNKSSQVNRKDMLEQYKKLSAVSIDMADDYFQSQVNSLLRENEHLNKRLEEKDIVIKDKEQLFKEKEQLFNKLLEEKEVVIKNKDVLGNEKEQLFNKRLEDKDVLGKEKEQLFNKRLEDKDVLGKEKEQLFNKLLEEKDIVIKNKDVLGNEKEQLFNKLLEAKEVSINEKELENMTSKGLLTARGILEAMLRKCLIEMKVLGLVKETEKDNMTNIIQHLTQKEKHFPETSKCYLLVQSAKRCGCDLQSLYVTLCSSIHGAPWYGSSIKIFSKALREEDTCLLKAIADDMSLPYDLHE